MQVKSEKVVRVWRIEDDYRDGPYVEVGKDTYEIIGSHTSSNGHPPPIHDNGIMRYVGANEQCGFLNLKQVYDWFSKKELQELEEKGFKLKRVLAKYITAIGEKQVLFERR